MSEHSHANVNNNNTSTIPPIDTEQVETTHLPAYAYTVFQRIEARDVEQFYKSYHFWLLQRRIGTLHTEVEAIQQAITDNATLMQQVHPSAIALASLAQLQASGVNDLDLLDKMLERGEPWLDHTMQLLKHCEKLDVIRGDYTQWCEHALEGAYNWIDSISATDTVNASESDSQALTTPNATSHEQHIALQTPTEAQLLQKLMSDEEVTNKIPAIHSLNEIQQETRKVLAEKDIPVEILESEQTNVESQIEHPEQIDETKDIIKGPGENEGTVAQEVTVNKNAVASSSKDADAHTVKIVPQEKVVDEETSDQTSTALVEMIATSRTSQKIQRQKGRPGGFWRFIGRLLARFYRKH